MSGRFVRQSSFRHVFGTAEKQDKSYTSINVTFNGDGNYVAGNGKFVAFAGKGGGGPVHVLNAEKTGRVPLNAPKLNAHKAKVLDFAFNPFNDNLLATASEDCYIKLSVIPDGGLTQNVSEAAVTFSGHEKKVTNLRWHPTANNILTSVSFDRTVKLWDAETGSEVLSFDGFDDTVFNVDYNRNGSQIAVISKDKKIRLYDPRTTDAVTTITSHEGTKKSSVFYVSKHGYVGSVGFTRSSKRQIHLWDPRNIGSKPLSSTDIDQSAGIFSTYYDHDTSLLFLAGKGDSSIRYYEITSDAPYAYFLSSFSDTQSQKGVAFLPKTACDVGSCEIARSLRILRDSIVPIGFKVPRKSDLFQKDLFPDSYAGAPALEAKAWLDGGNEDPILTSMKPGEQVRAKVEFTAKKSYAELEAELKKANARIKELEAQLGK
jgi:WD40 repeat protein